MNIFSAVCFIPILPVIYFMLRNEGKPKNNLILSTTLPKEAWEDSRVQAIVKKFRIALNITTLLLLLSIIPVFFISSSSIIVTYYMTWLLLIIVVPYIPYCYYVKQMRALKKENWYHPEATKVQIADTKSMNAPLHLKSSFSFVLPFIISLIPMLYPLAVPSDSSYFSLYTLCGTNSAIIIVAYLCYRFMLRRKDDRINTDTNVTMTLTHIRRYYWGKCWLMVAWFSSIYSFSSLLIRSYTLYFMIFSAVLVIVILVAVSRMEFAVRKVQQQYNVTEESVILMDEDDYWPYGAFYYNPQDTSFIVNNRIGIGTTMNMARPAAKVLGIICILILLGMPFLGIWMMKEEFTPVSVALTESSIQAYHCGLEYEVPFDSITDCYLLYDLPSASRNWGTSMEYVYKGDFSVKGIDHNCKLCINPHSTEFLVITTADKTYIFSMGKEEKFQELSNIYETMKLNLH